MNLNGQDATNARDEGIFIIADGYTGNDCPNYDPITDGYRTRVNSDWELEVATDCKNSTIRVRKGTPEHFNGIIGTTPTTITPVGESISILIHNPKTNSGNDFLQVSFDGGTNYFDIERRARLEIETEITSFMLKSNNSGTNYQIIATFKDC